MSLKTYKLGELISLVDERNLERIKRFYGININKEFMPTVANTNELDESKYKVVRKNRFVFSGMQTGRDECIRISMYLKDEPVIVSPAYVTFEISRTDLVLPMYFFMLFLSKEKDRLGWFYSDGSIRSNLDWPVFCDISITLPDLPTQQKYVQMYNSMIANQKSYEQGLDDLKLTCDAYLDKLKKECDKQDIGKYIVPCDLRNESEKLTIENLRGISTEKKFINTKADMMDVSLKNYKIVKQNEFVYVADTSRRGDKIALGFNDSNENILVSSIYTVFKIIDTDAIDPHYLMMFFTRNEFDRYARFNSWGSARETFDWSEMCSVKIPIPDIKVQRAIADIYKVYTERKRINEQLKQQIKDICPILIKGSLEE